MIEALLLSVLAFAAPDNFKVPAERGGGSGLRFTGSPSARWDCGVCHTPAPDLAFTVASPEPLFTEGYVPGATYELRLALGEPPLAGAFALEVVTRRGDFAGRLSTTSAPPPGELCDDGSNPVEIQGAGEAAQSVSCRKGLGAWRVRWTAPDSDVGPVTLYVALVAGDLDGSIRGDHAGARILAIRSPSSPREASGCGGTAAALLIPLGVLGVLARRRRGAGVTLVAVLLALAPGSARAAAPEPPSATVTAGVGVGFEGLSLSGPSSASPLLLQMLFPQATLAITLHPLRFIEGATLDELQLHLAYARGWSPLLPWVGDAFAHPSDALIALGYEARLGALGLTPRLAYRVRTMGIEENAAFDDALFQSLGGELLVEVSVGPIGLALRPQVLRLVDAGTLSVRGYGAFLGGWSVGGSAAASLRLGASPWVLSFEYAHARLRSAFAGEGERPLGPLEREDVVHSGALRVAYGR